MCVDSFIINPLPSPATDGVWIELTYPDGKPYHGHCGGAARTTRLIFLCDPLVPGLVSWSIINIDILTQLSIVPTWICILHKHTLMFRGSLTFLTRIGMIVCVSTRSL